MSSTLPKAPRSKSNSAGTAEKKPQIKKGIKKVPKKVKALAVTLAKEHPSEGNDEKHPAKGSRDTVTGQQVKQKQKQKQPTTSSSSSSSSSSLSLDKKSNGKFKI